MQNVVDSFFQSLASLLGPLGKFSKAIVPSATALAISVANAVIAGSFNDVSITAAALALVIAVVGYEVPNLK